MHTNYFKAYLLGCNDPQYQEMLRAICGIIFLATPHRGSGLADTLNRLLQLSGQSPKEYVGELQKNSSRIRDINDQFRLHASHFQIVSFFETYPTSMGLKKTVIPQSREFISLLLASFALGCLLI